MRTTPNREHRHGIALLVAALADRYRLNNREGAGNQSAPVKRPGQSTIALRGESITAGNPCGGAA